MPVRLLLRPLAGFVVLLIVASALGSDRLDPSTDGPAGVASVPPVPSASVPAAPAAQSRSAGRPRIFAAVRHDTSGPLRGTPAATTTVESEEADPDFKERRQIGRRGPGATVIPRRDPLLAPSAAAATAAVTPIVSFDGVSNRNAVSPPDPTGEVGRNHYVQWVNLSFAIYDRTGRLLYGPANGNTFWKGFGGTCETRNDGDPIVQYDQLADRWMVSQFSLPGGSAGYHQCIAVSATGDPLGAWYRYDFMTDSTLMNDYPKFGVWPNGYYLSVNQFSGGSTWAGAGAAAFEREAMLAGLPARMVYFDLYGTSPNLGGMLPSDLDGTALPPTGAPNVFAQFDDDSWGYSGDRLWLWGFSLDWADPGAATFTELGTPAVESFDSSLCSYSRSCIPQPGTSTKLDTLSDRLMYRLAYRNLSGTPTLVMNHSVDLDGSDHAGIRWYQLTSPNGSDWSVRQQGTHGPDAQNRWLGSIAMNKNGEIALAYAVASGSRYPSLRFTGRGAADTLGTMTVAESSLTEGTGSLTARTSRFGDYASLTLDPLDDCTFWYTGEYAAVTGSTTWRTRIGAFRLSACSGTAATGSIAGTVSDRATGTPLPNVRVTLTRTGAPDLTTSTNAFGTYGFTGLAGATYGLSATGAGYTGDTTAGIVVVDGRATSVAFRLSAKPTQTVAGALGSTWVWANGGDGNGYEAGVGNVGLTADGLVATDANSGTASSSTCPTTVRDGHDFARPATLPGDALVKGISVSLVGRASTKTGSPRFCVQLSTDGGATWTAGRTSGTLSTTSATLTVGAATDLWGRSWLPVDLASLRVRVTDLGGSTSLSYYLDAISVTATYQ